MNQLKTAMMIALTLVTTKVGAATLTFDYSVSGSVFSGTLLGTLQGDNDTFFVSQALELTLDGFTLDVSNHYIGQFSTLLDDLPDGTPIDPSISNIGVVSLSGQFIDLVICDREECTFGVAMNNNAFGFADSFLTFLSPDDNLLDGGFEESNWNAQVPLPAAGWLFFGALFGLRQISRTK